MIGRLFKSTGKQLVKPYTRAFQSVKDLASTGANAASEVKSAIDTIKSGKIPSSPYADEGRKIDDAHERFVFYARKHGIKPSEVNRRFHKCRFAQVATIAGGFLLFVGGLAVIGNGQFGFYAILLALMILFATTVAFAAAIWLALNAEQLRTKQLITLKEMLSKPDFMRRFFFPFFLKNER